MGISQEQRLGILSILQRLGEVTGEKMGVSQEQRLRILRILQRLAYADLEDLHDRIR